MRSSKSRCRSRLAAKRGEHPHKRERDGDEYYIDLRDAYDSVFGSSKKRQIDAWRIIGKSIGTFPCFTKHLEFFGRMDT